MSCIFCEIKEYTLENDLAYAIFDKSPVTKGHLLIIVKRHIEGYFESTREEKIAILDLIEEAKRYLEFHFSPDGYNIGVNVGEAAGQTVTHLHVHVIPRYKGDIEKPEGGVRGVIPAKQKYK